MISGCPPDVDTQSSGHKVEVGTMIELRVSPEPDQWPVRLCIKGFDILLPDIFSLEKIESRRPMSTEAER